MKTCIRYAPVALNESENYETRANLMWAGSMALNGVIRGGKIFDGFNHITEHTVSAIYDLTHGVGLSILMPHWLGEILDDDTAPKLSEYACNVWNESGGTEKELALKGIKRTKGFLQDLGLPTRFSDAGIPADRFEDIARKSLSGNETLGQFKPLDFAGIMRVLERAK
jgi:alcohol dehydrogenase YqhD (iron-dependent ADH family)